MQTKKKDLITGATGITGQDGSLLVKLLLNKGYQVHGIVRRVARKVIDINFREFPISWITLPSTLLLWRVLGFYSKSWK